MLIIWSLNIDMTSKDEAAVRIFDAENGWKFCIVVSTVSLKSKIFCNYVFTKNCELRPVSKVCRNTSAVHFALCKPSMWKICSHISFRIGWFAVLFICIIISALKNHTSGSPPDSAQPHSRDCPDQINANLKNRRQQMDTIRQQNSGKEWNGTGPEYNWAMASKSADWLL